MKFELQLDNDDIMLQGDVTIELPNYFVILPLTEIRDDKEKIIVACGRKNPSDDIEFLTGNGRLMTFKIADSNFPIGKGVPVDGGRAIVFVENNPVKLIDSMFMINNAKTLVNT